MNNIQWSGCSSFVHVRRAEPVFRQPAKSTSETAEQSFRFKFDKCASSRYCLLRLPDSLFNLATIFLSCPDASTTLLDLSPQIQAGIQRIASLSSEAGEEQTSELSLSASVLQQTPASHLLFFKLIEGKQLQLDSGVPIKTLPLPSNTAIGIGYKDSQGSLLSCLSGPPSKLSCAFRKRA